MAALNINPDQNFIGQSLLNIDRFEFLVDPGPADPISRPTFSSAQFGPGLISNAVFIDGNAVAAELRIDLLSGAVFSAAGWSFGAWSNNNFISFLGESGGETVSGSVRADQFIPGIGKDTFDGNAGNDTLVLGSGIDLEDGDQFDGDLGTDTIRIAGPSDSYDFTQTQLAGFENLVLTAAGFADHVIFLTGSQIGTGAIVSVSSPTDLITFLSIVGNAIDLSGVAFPGFDADDTIEIVGTGNLAQLVGSNRADVILGAISTPNMITGGKGADTVSGAGANDTFRLAPGDLSAGEIIDGNGGIDTIRLGAAGAAAVFDFGAATIQEIESVVFEGANASEARFGGAQAGPGGVSAFTGSTGRNSLVVAATAIDLSAASFTSWTDGVDRVFLTLTGSIGTITGSSVADVMTGGRFGDTMNGGAGDDTFIVATATDARGDRLNGGPGTDTLRLAATLGPDEFVNLHGMSISEIEVLEFALGQDSAVFLGVDTIGVLSTAATQTNIMLVRGSEFSDSIDLTGTRFILSDVVFENWTDGVDTITLRATVAGGALVGSSRNDVLVALSPALAPATMEGGLGDDTYVNPGPFTSVIEEFNGGVDTVESDVSFTLRTNLENLVLRGVGSRNGTGNTVANRIQGNDGANILRGMNGDDTLEGGNGNDQLDGGAEIDLMRGGAGDDIYINPTLSGIGKDTIQEETDGGRDTVRSDVTVSIATISEVERIELTGTAAVNATGNALDNSLVGNTAANAITGGGGNDTLNGGAGNDTLDGGGGNDTINGGTGADVFRFAGNGGTDTINGFSSSEDRFDLSAGAFTIVLEVNGNTRLSHAGGTAVIAGVTGLSLEQWNALILPEGSAAPMPLSRSALGLDEVHGALADGTGLPEAPASVALDFM